MSHEARRLLHFATGAFARSAYVVGQTEERHQADVPPGEVEFPEPHAVASRTGIRMVVVVPAFTPGEQGDPPPVT